YREKLSGIKGLMFLNDLSETSHAYTYFPVLIDESLYGMTRDEVYNLLKSHNIYGRRYFYPLISQFPTYRGLPSSQPENLPVATRVAGQVICLPLYPALEQVTVDRIAEILKNKR
ncbi:DegT/DnrJ/EryC1/StrS family aminotransferase, partial [bacterium]|nr:DegT/DnrJ/EryC1/StrS family aminotransferase [bacterium]